MLMPKRVKRRKQFRGSMAGKALRGNKITNGEYGLVALAVWGMDCTSCLACYHVCPQHAVQYGKRTKDKGQYFNPNQSTRL